MSDDPKFELRTFQKLRVLVRKMIEESDGKYPPTDEAIVKVLDRHGWGFKES